MNKQLHLGTFALGHINVDLFVWTGQTCGEFYFCPDETSKPRIKVGLAYNHWDECLATLLHEVIEFCMTMMDCRYRHSGKLNDDHADYKFLMDHCQFGDVCSESAVFLAKAIPLVAAAYNKARKKR